MQVVVLVMEFVALSLLIVFGLLLLFLGHRSVSGKYLWVILGRLLFVEYHFKTVSNLKLYFIKNDFDTYFRLLNEENCVGYCQTLKD